MLVEIGADVSASEGGEIPLCIAVQSNNKKMVELLLKHNVANASVREALNLSWQLGLDSISGLLLQHIAVDKQHDSINFSGLELTNLKPLWILPSLGVKTSPGSIQQRRHRKQGSLGHVKDFLIRRKSVATDMPFESEQFHSTEKASRRQSVDLSAMKYVSDIEVSECTEYSVFSNSSPGATKLTDLEETDNLVSKSTTQPCPGSQPDVQTNDSAADMVGTALQHSVSMIDPSSCKMSGQTFRSVSVGSLHRQIHGALSGATTLPHSTLDTYTKYSNSNNIAGNSTYSDASFPLSPSQLFKKMRKHHRKSVKSSLVESSNFNRIESPIPVIYYQQDDSSALVSTSDASLAYHDYGPTEEESGGFTSNVSVSVSTLSSEMSRHHNLSGNDEVDFSSCEPIPEEPSHTDKYPVLIQNIDLSSNKLSNFNSLVSSPYNDLVLKRIKGVKAFDVKQNCLSELSSVMMKV